MSATALLVIDMLNAFDFDEPGPLIAAASEIVDPINALRGRMRAEGSPVIYVNDNHGRWRDDRRELIAWLGREGAPGASIARALAPGDDDYFVIKPEASGFYATTLPALLHRLGVTALILTGIAAELCVQFTAADAHMREYQLWVPADAVAGTSPERTRWALDIMANGMSADVRPTTEREIAG